MKRYLKLTETLVESVRLAVEVAKLSGVHPEADASALRYMGDVQCMAERMCVALREVLNRQKESL